jgi:hypothetical protein
VGITRIIKEVTDEITDDREQLKIKAEEAKRQAELSATAEKEAIEAKEKAAATLKTAKSRDQKKAAREVTILTTKAASEARKQKRELDKVARKCESATEVIATVARINSEQNKQFDYHAVAKYLKTDHLVQSLTMGWLTLGSSVGYGSRTENILRASLRCISR